MRNLYKYCKKLSYEVERKKKNYEKNFLPLLAKDSRLTENM